MPQLGVDYSFARPSPDAIRAGGYTFVVRYVAPSSESAKTLSVGEASALHAAGLSILLVFEDGASNALGGAVQGSRDGQIAKAAAQALGYPTACPIFASVDFDAQPDQIATVDAYFAAFANAIGPWPAGTYGDMAVGASEPDAPYWESEGWDGTTIAGKAVLYQRITPSVANPVPGTDEDVLLGSIPMWAPGMIVTPPPPAPPTPVPAPVPTPPPSIPVLREGTTGLWVGKLQRDLNSLHAALRVDEDFGPATLAAVIAFQRNYHLGVDGIVGPQTWGAIYAALGRNHIVPA